MKIFAYLVIICYGSNLCLEILRARNWTVRPEISGEYPGEGVIFVIFREASPI